MLAVAFSHTDQEPWPEFPGIQDRQVGGAYDMVVADFNGDGPPHLAVASESLLASGSAPGVEIFEVENDGYIPYSHGFPTTGSHLSLPISLAVADFNHDGRPDLVVGDEFFQIATVLINTSTAGGFSFGGYRHISGTSDCLAAGDINGDGKVDLATANASDDSVSVLLGNGDGTFQAGATLAVGDDPRWVAIADWNGDGKKDLAAANFGANAVSVLLGRGNGTFKNDRTFPTSAGPFELAVADWRQDGKPDLLVLSDNSGSPMAGVFAGNGQRFFTPGEVYDVLQPVPRDSDGDGTFDLAIVTADFNNDGKPDVAGVNDTNNSIRVRLGVGDGTLGNAIDVPYPTGVAPISIVAGDFDEDGKIDLITGNSSNMSWLRGKGDGAFHDPVTYSFNTVSDYFPESPTYRPLELVAGDFNGDGHADLAMRLTAFSGSYQVGPGLGVGVVLGNGDGTFRGNGDVNGLLSPYLYLHDLYNPGNGMAYLLGSSLGVGDLDRDGFSDLVVNAYNTLYVFRGRADGTLEQTETYSIAYSILEKVYRIELADVNGDGWLDLAYENLSEAKLRLNNGDGTFGSPIALDSRFSDGVLSFGDMNGDGRLDLIDRDALGIRVQLGRGNGTFETPSRDPVSGGLGRWLGVADFDGDGRLDVFPGTQMLLNIRPPVTLSNASVEESQPIGAFHADDPSDPGNFFVYELVSGAGGADNALFTIDAAGNLRTAAAFGYNAKASYAIRVRATDSVGVVTERAFAIGVTSDNEASTGDFDADGHVDGHDFLAWQRGVGTTTGAVRAQGDANQDGDVDAVDFVTWRGQYGQTPPVLAAALVDAATASRAARDEAPDALGLGDNPAMDLVRFGASGRNSSRAPFRPRVASELAGASLWVSHAPALAIGLAVARAEAPESAHDQAFESYGDDATGLLDDSTRDEAL